MDTVHGDPVTVSELRKGLAINHTYQLQGRIASGAMGEVWLARHMRWMDRPVAVKFLRNVGDSDRAIEQLFKEAEIMASLLHDGIVRLFNVDRLAGRTPFLVMEYLAGPNLAQLLRHGSKSPARLTPEECLHVLAQVAPALDYAHAKGVTHRDIKPANLMLDSPVDGSILRHGVKLADFGIALSLDGDATVRLAGTPWYMAPESLPGADPNAQRRTPVDIYGLGATLYHLAAGQPPFVGEADEVLFSLQNDAAPRLQTGHAAFDDAVAKALAKDPRERPSSAAAFYAAASGVRERVVASSKVAPQGTRPGSAAVEERSAPLAGQGPRLFVRSGGPYHIAQNHVLEFAVINDGAESVQCWVQVDAVHPDALTVFNAEREMQLEPGRGEWALVSFRAQEFGRNEVRVRIHFRQDSGGTVTRTWEVAESGVFVEVEPDSPGQVYVHPEVRCELPRSGEVGREFRRLCDSLAGNAAASGSGVEGVKLKRPAFAWGVVEQPEGDPVGRQWVVDAWRDGERLQRFRVFFESEFSFGRCDQPHRQPQASTSHLALCWLPCRSRQEDPDNYDRNRFISRDAGVVSCDELGTVLRSSSSALRVNGEGLKSGESRRLISESATRVELGSLEEPLRLEFFACRGRRRYQALCQLLEQAPAYSTTAQPVLASTAIHPHLIVRRVGNRPDLSYVLAMPWVGVGGGGHDACRVPGLPSSFLFLARFGSRLWTLVSPVALPSSAEPMWRPLVEECEVGYRDFRITMREARPGELALEADLFGERA